MKDFCTRGHAMTTDNTHVRKLKGITYLTPL
jgi:hypothetical protein